MADHRAPGGESEGLDLRTLVVAFAVLLVVVLSSTTLVPSRAAASDLANVAPAMEQSTPMQPSIVVLQNGQPIDSKGTVARSDSAQVTWIDCALPVIHDKVTSHNSQSPSIPMMLGNWYELFDHLTGGGNSDTYGIIHSDLTEKPGYGDLRNWIPAFYV